MKRMKVLLGATAVIASGYFGARSYNNFAEASAMLKHNLDYQILCRLETAFNDIVSAQVELTPLGESKIVNTDAARQKLENVVLNLCSCGTAKTEVAKICASLPHGQTYGYSSNEKEQSASVAIADLRTLAKKLCEHRNEHATWNTVYEQREYLANGLVLVASALSSVMGAAAIVGGIKSKKELYRL